MGGSICPIAILYFTGGPMAYKMFACKRFKNLADDLRDYFQGFILFQSLLNPSNNFAFDAIKYHHAVLAASNLGLSLIEFYTSQFSSTIIAWVFIVTHFVTFCKVFVDQHIDAQFLQISYIWVHQLSRIAILDFI